MYCKLPYFSFKHLYTSLFKNMYVISNQSCILYQTMKCTRYESHSSNYLFKVSAFPLEYSLRKLVMSE